MERQFNIGDHVCIAEWSNDYGCKYRGKVGVVKKFTKNEKIGVELDGLSNNYATSGLFWICEKNLIPQEDMNNLNDEKTVLIGDLKNGYSYVTPKEAEEIHMKNDRKIIEDFQDMLTKMFLYSEHSNIMLSNKSVEITKVIFNNPATIVFWSDGKKTVVKCSCDEAFDEEKGLAMAISKRVLGNKGNYYNEFKKWLPEIEVCEDKGVTMVEACRKAHDAFERCVEI